MRAGATLRLPRDDTCKHNRTFAPDMQIPTSQDTQPFLHQQCIGNEIVSLRNRVLMDTIPADWKYCMELRKRCKKTGYAMPPTRELTFDEAFAAMPTKKRLSYLNLVDRYHQEGVLPRDSRITAFIKYERLVDGSKDPRMIQFRGKKYGLALGRYLKQIEHHLYRLKVVEGFPVGRLVAKGLNNIKRASLLRKKLAQFRDPVVYSLDAKRFDAHVGRLLLQAEHALYTAAIHNPELNRLLQMQLVNKGTTGNGIKYRCPGGRMSGDMNTALGNCILMVHMVAQAFSHIKFKDVLDDGDDILLIVERADEHLIPLGIENMRKFGMEVSIDNVTDVLEKVTFCQSRPVFDGVGYKFIRNPHKSLGFGVNARKTLGSGTKAYAHYLVANGLCEMALSTGVPCLQAYGKRLVDIGRSLGGKGKLNQLSAKQQTRLRQTLGVKTDAELERIARWREVTPRARQSFALAWDISPDEQVHIEAMCGQLLPGERLSPPQPDQRWAIIPNSAHITPLTATWCYPSVRSATNLSKLRSILPNIRQRSTLWCNRLRSLLPSSLDLATEIALHALIRRTRWTSRLVASLPAMPLPWWVSMAVGDALTYVALAQIRSYLPAASDPPP